MNAVINTSPLIFLAKLDFLEALDIYERIYTTDIVIDETKRGFDKGFSEGLEILRSVEEKRIEVVEVTLPTEEMKALHPGERSVIELAKDLGVKDIIVDDRMAIQAAKFFGLRPISTPFLLIANVKQGTLDKERFRHLMDRLFSFNYYISPGLYVKIIDKLEEL